MIMLAMKIAGVGATPYVLSRVAPLAPPCSTFFPLPLKLRSAAVRMARPPCGVKSQEGGPAPEEEEQDMVFIVLFKEAQNSLALLSRVSTLEEDMGTAADLKDYLSNLAAAACKGEVHKPDGVRAFIGGVHRLIELAYKSYPFAPRVTAATTEEEFVNYFMAVGEEFPYVSSALVFTESMGQYPDSEIDRALLTSIITSMNLARVLVNGMTTNQLEILDQFPGDVDKTGLPAPQDGRQLPSDGTDSAGGTPAAD